MAEPKSDQQIICKDCGASFTVTAGEAAFYNSKGLTFPPLRCPACRRRRRESINPDPGVRRG